MFSFHFEEERMKFKFNFSTIFSSQTKIQIKSEKGVEGGSLQIKNPYSSEKITTHIKSESFKSILQALLKFLSSEKVDLH